MPLTAWGLLAALVAGHTELPLGAWRAWLDSPGGALPFGLVLERGDEGLRAFLVNGEEELAVPHVAFENGVLALDMPHYDSRVDAVFADGALEGTWRRRRSADAWTEMVFHAVHGEGPRFVSDAEGSRDRASSEDLAPASSVDGRYSVRFESSADPAVGIFRSQADGTLSGTFLTTTGDYRFLAGDVRGDRLRLSCFDGAHAFLFTAQITDGADGALAGDFYSGGAWHERWTAVRDERAALPDPYAQTTWSEACALADAVFPDLDGVPRSLADPAFAGRARIVQVFGTWCPNCNDEAPFLAELDRRHRPRGLSIVALAFELSGDFERDAEQVRRYAKRHGASFPMLLAGLADKASATRAFPALDFVRAYPTTIFLHGDGRVRAVHSGFSGPATGDAHVQLRAEFEALIEELLAEEPRRDAAWDFVVGRRFVCASDGAVYAFRERAGEREVLVEMRPKRTNGAEDVEAALADFAEALRVRVSGGALFFDREVLHVDREALVLLDPRCFGRRFAPDGTGGTPSLDVALWSDERGLERAIAASSGLARREALVALAELRRAHDLAGNSGALAYLEDPALDVVLAAVWSLGVVRELSAVPALVELLTDANAAVRREAALALGSLGVDTEDVRRSLAALANDADPLVRAAAAQALAR